MGGLAWGNGVAAWLQRSYGAYKKDGYNTLTYCEGKVLSSWVRYCKGIVACTNAMLSKSIEMQREIESSNGRVLCSFVW